MERLGESSSKKHNNALKATKDTSDGESESDKSNESSKDEEVFLSRRLQRILAKKKYQSGRRYFKKDCKKPGHIKAECPKLKKTEFKKKDNTKKFKRYKKKAMATAWDNENDSDSESSSSEEEEENANLAFMANIDDKKSKKNYVAEAKTEKQWARGHKTLYNKFLNARSARFPPRDHSLTLSEWFQILHKDTWALFVQKEIKMIRFTHFCLGSVDTRSSQVDTRPSFQQTSLPDWDSRSTLDQVDTRSKQVDTRSGQVDTRPSFQQTSLLDWDSRSTLD
ncbi:hypothetical protein Taro_038665 [Colocasia esculenta]|uniref:CCHC-type domain-containing protein n=1 Tax=Colocasia esculenta TaxID=4460 RepID=A0A843W8Q2_COLES|nr:hypothetical protein [Colocasia esculenta]